MGETIRESAREQIKRLERELAEHQQRVRGAQDHVEEKRSKTRKEIDEIDRILPQKLILYFLGDFDNEAKAIKEISSLKARKAKKQDFLEIDYPLVKNGLEVEFKKQTPEQRHISTLRARVSTFDSRWEQFKKSRWNQTASDKDMLLKAAEEAGELEWVLAEIEKLAS